MKNFFLIIASVFCIFGCSYNMSDEQKKIDENIDTGKIYEFVQDADYIFKNYKTYSDANENAINLYTGYYIVRLDDSLNNNDWHNIENRILERGYIKKNKYKKSLIYCKGPNVQLEVLEPHRDKNLDTIDDAGDVAVQLQDQWNFAFYWKRDGNILCK